MPSSEGYSIALCFSLSNDGGVGNGVGDDGGGGGQGVHQGRGHGAELSDSGDQGCDQSCQKGAVAMQKLQCVGHQMCLSLDHWSGNCYNLKTHFTLLDQTRTFLDEIQFLLPSLLL